MRRLVAGLALLAVLVVSAAALARPRAPSYPVVQLTIDGAGADFYLPSYLVGNVPMVPVRLFEEKLGYQLDNHLERWKIIQLLDERGRTVVSFRIGERRALSPVQVAGGIVATQVPMPAPAQVIEGRLYVPGEAVLKGIGRRATWEPETRTLHISSKPLIAP